VEISRYARGVGGDRLQCSLRPDPAAAVCVSLGGFGCLRNSWVCASFRVLCSGEVYLTEGCEGTGLVLASSGTVLRSQEDSGEVEISRYARGVGVIAFNARSCPIPPLLWGGIFEG